jgi:hypothetical protein
MLLVQRNYSIDRRIAPLDLLELEFHELANAQLTASQLLAQCGQG